MKNSRKTSSSVIGAIIKFRIPIRVDGNVRCFARSGPVMSTRVCPVVIKRFLTDTFGTTHAVPMYHSVVFHATTVETITLIHLLMITEGWSRPRCVRFGSRYSHKYRDDTYNKESAIHSTVAVNI